MTNFNLENVEAHCSKLIQSIDATDMKISNTTIYSPDSLLTFTDSRNIIFQQLRIINPANKIVTNLSGDLTDFFLFENDPPHKLVGGDPNSCKNKLEKAV